MKWTTLFLGLSFVGSLSCATTSGLRSQSLEAGTVREFAGEYGKVLRATREAVVGADLAIDSFDESTDSTAVIVAKKGASAFSWGELVRIVVKQSSSDRTSVRVVTKRRLATNVTAKGDYAETIFSNIQLSLQ